MRQLGIIDAGFINMEHPTIPQHIGGIGIYDPSTAADGFVRFKDVLANFEQRLHKLPIFRTRLIEVPFGIARPYWVLDRNFDVEFHIRHIALPQPGDWRQLCIQVARLHSRPIDMSRPLWEVYIIEGLDNIPDLPQGSFAVYTKMHHSLVDGAAGQSFMAALHDLAPVPPPADTTAEFGLELAEIDPTDIWLLGKSMLRMVPDTLAKVRAGAGFVGDMISMATKMYRSELPPLKIHGPKTRFDEPVGPNRVFEARLFDLEEIKALKNAAGLTINDIAVALVAGTLRHYLLAHNELPEESLVGSMPVNMRTRIGETGENNQVGSMSAALHTHIADPVQRLYAIKKSLDDGKAYIDTPLVSAMKITGVLPPAIAKRAARFYVRNKLTRRLPMGQATVITNVPGPPFALYCAGAQMVSYYPLGLLMPGLGCFHAVFSCAGKISISVLADRKQMPDPEFYRQCMDSAYEELRAALLKPAPRQGARAKPQVKKTPVRGAASKPRKAPTPSTRPKTVLPKTKPKRAAGRG